MSSPQFLLGAGGKLLLVGGKPLLLTPGTAPTSSINLVAWYVVNPDYKPRFQVHTTASSGDTAGNVPIVFTYGGGAPSSVQAKVVDANNADVVPWTDITSSVTTDGAGNGLGYLNGVPAGINYKRMVRVGTSSTLIATDTGSFNIGIMLMPWGQSNMRGTLEGNVGMSHIVPGTNTQELDYYFTNGTAAQFGPQGFVGANNPDVIGSYGPASGGGMSLLRIAGTLLQSHFSRKVGIGMNPWAQNGFPMSMIMNSAGVIPMLTNTGTSSHNQDIGFSSPPQYASGDYRIVAWHQGEGEDAAVTRAYRSADLIKFCQAHINQVAKYGRTPDKLTFLFAFMGVYWMDTATGESSAAVPHAEVLRAAVLDLIQYVKDNNLNWDVRIGWNCVDLDPKNNNDRYHFAGEDLRRSNRRMLQSMLNVLDPVAVKYSGLGPTIQGTTVKLDAVTSIITGNATRAGDVVTIKVTHEGNDPNRTLAALNPANPITGWYANTAPDFSGTDLAVTNVAIVDSTHVQMTVTGAPTTFYIKHCGGKFYTQQSWHSDVTNLIFDNFAYPSIADPSEQLTGLPLNPTPNAIKVG